MISRRTVVLGLAALPPVLALPALLAAEPVEAAGRLGEAARAQIGVTLFYDGTYRRLAYPGGDVDPERGVCTDVVVRAYRTALGADLQRLVHEDMAANFSAYPANWGLTRPDRKSITGGCRTSRPISGGRARPWRRAKRSCPAIW